MVTDKEYKDRNQQESPPAWTQEAYRPSCSKCSLCRWGGGGYPIQLWWGGYPIQSWLGSIPSRPGWGGYPTPSSHGGGRYPGTPWPGLDGGGVPHPVMGYPPHHLDLAGGYPHHPDLARGTPGTLPPSRPGMGYPPPSDLGWGTPHHQPWDGVPPTIRPGMGYPPTIRPGMGYPPPSRPGWGTPQSSDLAGVPPPPSRPGWGTPPGSRCGLTNKLKTVPSPILRMRAVIRIVYLHVALSVLVMRTVKFMLSTPTSDSPAARLTMPVAVSNSRMSGPVVFKSKNSSSSTSGNVPTLQFKHRNFHKW